MDIVWRKSCPSCRNVHILSMGNRLSPHKNSLLHFSVAAEKGWPARYEGTMACTRSRTAVRLERKLCLDPSWSHVLIQLCVDTWNMQFYLKSSDPLYILAQVRFSHMQLTAPLHLITHGQSISISMVSIKGFQLYVMHSGCAMEETV